MILVIDSGNSRVKFGVRARGDPLASDWARLGTLAASDIATLPRTLADVSLQQIVVANVAGDGVGANIAAVIAAWPVPVTWAESRTAQCGVTNGYDQPGQLGVDRWIALIAAWHRRHAATVVVSCGTATTVDVLADDGRFEGGAILPGLDLMKRLLATGTDGLRLLDGHHRRAPRTTADAIETGCLRAQAGAIERSIAAASRGATCLITGGAAPRIAPLIAGAIEHVPHLTLEGLALVAAGEAPS